MVHPLQAGGCYFLSPSRTSVFQCGHKSCLHARCSTRCSGEGTERALHGNLKEFSNISIVKTVMLEKRFTGLGMYILLTWKLFKNSFSLALQKRSSQFPDRQSFVSNIVQPQAYTRDSLAIYPFSLGNFFQILLPFVFTEQSEFWFENLYPRISEDTFSIKKSLKRNLWAKKSLKRNLWKKSTRRISQEQPFQEISLPKVASRKIYPKNSEENKEKSSTKRSLRRNLYQRILDDQFSTKSFLKRKLHSKNPSIRSTQYLYQGLFANHLPKNALTKISSKTNQKTSSPDFLPRKMSSKVSLMRNPCQKTA